MKTHLLSRSFGFVRILGDPAGFFWTDWSSCGGDSAIIPSAGWIEIEFVAGLKSKICKWHVNEGRTPRC